MTRPRALAWLGGYLVVMVTVARALGGFGGWRGLVFLVISIIVMGGLERGVRVGHLGARVFVRDTALGMTFLLAFFAWLILIDSRVDPKAYPWLNFAALMGGVLVIVAIGHYASWRLGIAPHLYRPEGPRSGSCREVPPNDEMQLTRSAHGQAERGPRR